MLPDTNPIGTHTAGYGHLQHRRTENNKTTPPNPILPCQPPAPTTFVTQTAQVTDGNAKTKLRTVRLELLRRKAENAAQRRRANQRSSTTIPRHRDAQMRKHTFPSRSAGMRWPNTSVYIRGTQHGYKTIIPIYVADVLTLPLDVHGTAHTYVHPGRNSEHNLCRLGISSTIWYASTRRHSQWRTQSVTTRHCRQKSWKT